MRGRALVAAIVVGVGAAALSSCGGGEEPEAEASKQSAQDEATTTSAEAATSQAEVAQALRSGVGMSLIDLPGGDDEWIVTIAATYCADLEKIDEQSAVENLKVALSEYASAYEEEAGIAGPMNDYIIDTSAASIFGGEAEELLCPGASTGGYLPEE